MEDYDLFKLEVLLELRKELDNIFSERSNDSNEKFICANDILNNAEETIIQRIKES